MQAKQSGFTLIEIAIVLVIIGLLLGGVLKGQELIQNARVRNIIAQQDGIKAAFFGFQDRYRGVPGDYPATLANQNIPGADTVCGGDGNSLIEAKTVTGSPEYVCAWYHLSKAGFITGNYSGTGTDSDANNSPANPFGGLIQLIFDNVYLDTTQNPPKVHNIKTGINIPSTVLAEVDRKIDDGKPASGSFRYSSWNVPEGSGCVSDTSGTWTWDNTGAQTVCGGATLF
ncbi:MAG: prepilin-type N-terminal cleavage/methylation domain-containing protein [Burkholderiales bacterium]|nr:prepilin-type N-terminal cleavage/methylation domain-containing protein [Burkholderiales bacterium]